MNSSNAFFIKSALGLVKNTKAASLFVFVDSFEYFPLPENIPRACQLILVSEKKLEIPVALQNKIKKIIQVPSIDLGRLGLIKLTMALALSQALVKHGDKVVFLSHLRGQKYWDTLLLIQIGKESELITSKNISGISESVKPEVFEHLLSLTLELASKGREGKAIGTIFVVGDQDRVMQLSKQMIINPFKGYDESERNILNPLLKETIREFSALDGAFIVSDEGVLITAGRFLGAAHDEEELPRGLGSRHIAAAGITALTNAIAIVISESTGDVRIFKNGKILMEIEKP
ncbi:MAG: DNA integrity scanning protein DisA nucleotide-binding domain protein [Deltaproteobacteria bacterium]|nr:DNA integrity scanning protein DisA nucleotide-binding domain protein [Deltaproteobacteria bacterium]